MPFRIIGYDGNAYRAQLLEKKKTVVSVVTMVLYFGTEDRRKMQGTEVERILEKEYQGFRYEDISSDHLCVLIQELGKDLNEKMIVKKLRSVEGSLRNLAAHQIISVTSITIQSQTGYTGKQIMEMLKKTFAFAEMGIKKEYWESYDDMNIVIVRQMDKMYDEC